MRTITCLACARSLRLPEDLGNRKVRCPSCGSVQLPQPSTADTVDQNPTRSHVLSTGDETHLESPPAPPRKSAETASAETASVDAGVGKLGSETISHDRPDRTARRHADTENLPLPPKIGRFVVRSCLGEGAFGRVYEAHDPQLDREVALKVAKLDRGDADHRVKRFLREAKSAANLRHPGIVPLFEFGREGADFFIASAYIRGRTLKEEIARRRKSGERDLAWAAATVRALAEALGYAHDQGIVHRDVKPANVLLDEKLAPMLTDFGLATRQDEAEQLTHQGQILGTPLYMAPEQARGRDGSAAQPASDQYALGVMLYEMIAGRPPFEGSPELVMFHHQETEPVRPRKHDSRISLDLETICLKMLEKDPTRRYPNCLEAAEDLRRCQAGEPIQARRIGRWERIGRWTRRNPLAALLTGAVALSLILGTVVSLCFAILARDQAALALLNEGKAREQEAAARRNEAEARRHAAEALRQTHLAQANESLAKEQAEKARREGEKAKRVAQFLSGLFDANDPVGLTGYAFGPDPKQGSQLSAREVLLRGVTKIRSELKDQPETRASVLVTVGSVLRMLGQYDEAQPLLEEALDLRKKLPGIGPGPLAEAWFHLSWLHHMRGDHPRSLAGYRETLRLAGGDPALAELANRCEFNIAWMKTERRDIEEAERLFRKILKERRDLYGPDHLEVAAAQAGLASALLHDERKAIEAIGLITPALETFRKGHGDASVANSLGLGQQAIVAAILGQHQVADAKMRQATAITRKAMGENHPFVAWAMGIHGNLLERTGKKAEAVRLYEDCLDVCRKGMGLDHPMVLRLVEQLADLKGEQGDEAGGRALYEELHREVCRGKGDHHFLAVQVAYSYGLFLRSKRRFLEAETWLRRVLESDRRHPEFFAAEACAARNQIGLLFFRQDPLRAAEWFQAALADFDRLSGTGSNRYVDRRIVLRNRIEALLKARVLEGLAAVVAALETLPQENAEEAAKDRSFAAEVRKRLQAMIPENAVHATALLGLQALPGAIDWTAPSGLMDLAFFEDPLLEMRNTPILKPFFDQESEIAPTDPVDPKTRRPHKVFLVPLRQGQAYQFDLMSKEIDPMLSLASRDGRLLAKDDDGGGNLDSRIRWTCPQDGEYSLIADAYGAKLHGRFRLRCSLMQDDVSLALAPRPTLVLRHAGRLTLADPLDVPKVRTRTRRFAWNVAQGHPYLFALESDRPGWSIQVEEPETHKVLGKSETFGSKATLRFIPDRTGPVRVAVVGKFPGDASVKVTATLPLLTNELLGAADCLNPGPVFPHRLAAVGRRPWLVSPALANPGSTVFLNQGRLTPTSSLDPLRKVPFAEFPVMLQQGRRYRIDLRSRQFDAFLRLEDGRGKVLAADDDSGGNLDARVVFVPPATGVYKVVATQFRAQFGEFTLQIVEDLPLRHAVAKEFAWKATDPWDAPPVDKRMQILQVPLEGNQLYRIDLKSRDFDAFLRLEDAAGRILATDDDGGGGLDARIRFRPLRGGTYRLVVTTFGENETGDYLLTIRK